MSKKRPVIIGIAIFLGAVAVIVGILFLIRSQRSTNVNVFSVSDFTTSGDYTNAAETYGMVSTDKIQSVHLSDTQKVTEVYVSEGQEVKAGDPLLAYDTTLTELELQKKGVEIQQLELQIEAAEKKLAEIKAYKPYVPPPEPSPTPEPEEPTNPVVTPAPSRLSGSGTVEDPYKYMWDAQCIFSESFVASLFGEDGRTQVYAQFYIYEQNSLECEKLASWGMVFSRTETGYNFSLYEVTDGAVPEQPEPEPEPEWVDDSSGYTAAEIAAMCKEKEAEIVTLNISWRMAQVEYKQMEREMNDGVVVSQFDGVVTSVQDEETALQLGVPMIKVSGGGGYYIQVAVGEFDLGSIAVGQEVTVNSWESGTFATGVISEISLSPTKDASSYSEGNNNISYYPFTVFVEEEANLKENEYVSVVYSTLGEEEAGFYLESAFIRRENGKSYVYAENDGELEKREVSTGRTLWGSYLEIRSGLTQEDYISFPYGDGAVEGTKTVHASSDQLYNMG